MPIECGIQQLNKLLMHYGCPSSVGVQLQSSMELFLIELGRTHQPFDESFQLYQSWITSSWVKSIWEKVDHYGYKIVLNNIDFPFPRVGDKWLMRVFEDLGYDQKELRRLNRVRLHQQVLFLSDVLCVKGKKIDPKYKRLRWEDETWSNRIFPYEEPSSTDLKIWKSALNQLAPGGRLSVSARVGNWVHVGHKLQPWRYDDEANILFRHHGEDLMDEYPRAMIPPHHTNSGRYTKFGSNRARTPCNVACTVEEMAPAIYRVVNHASIPGPSLPPTTLWEVLEQWGSMWMWDDLELTGSFEFLVAAIIDGSLTCVSDGSYIKEMYPDSAQQHLFWNVHGDEVGLLGNSRRRHSPLVHIVGNFLDYWPSILFYWRSTSYRHPFRGPLRSILIA